jgi:hypothetical protein
LGAAFLVAVSACGRRTPEAKTPSEAVKSAPEKAAGAPTEEGKASTPASASSDGDKSKAETKASSCGGVEIADLLATISQSACELPEGKRDKQDRDVKDVLEIKVLSNARHIPPGSTEEIAITFHNKGAVDLPLDFVVDPEPRFEFELYTRKGARVDKPPGGEPALPPEIAKAGPPEKQIARITLAPQGTAKLSLTWAAVKYRWASKERAKGAAAGHGYPREPAGPVPKGKYVLRVVTPLVGIQEGADHEISRPSIPIDVGF